MKIIKLLTVTFIIIAFAYINKYAYQSGYQQGVKNTQIDLNRNQLVRQLADARYVAQTYKNLYQVCAGEDVEIKNDLENVLLNLEIKKL